MPNYLKKSRSFNDLSKSDKLAVLGTIFNALVGVPARRVYLDNIMTNAPGGCGSMGCVVGWAAARRKSANALGLKVDKEGVLYEKNGESIGHEHVFNEYGLSDFLFGPYSKAYTMTPTTEYQPKRTALARLLYVGHLVDQDQWKGSDWEGSGQEAKASAALKNKNHWVNQWLDENGGDANLVMDQHAQGTGRGEGNPW